MCLAINLRHITHAILNRYSEQFLMLRKTFPWDGIVPAIEVRLLAPLSLITAVRELHFICLKFSCHFSEALD